MSASFDMHNRIGTEEFHDLVLHQVQTLFARPDLAARLPPLMVWGAPGIGKSTILREVADELGIGFIDVRLAQREPVDIRGLPVPDGENNQVRWLVSSDWPREPGSRGIILFDELTAADRSLQVAAYEFILDRRLGDLYQVPDGWYICAAGNRVEDAAVATTMSSALANRFLHVELRENAEEWVRWGQRHGIRPSILGFIRYRPDLLFHQEKENLERGWPSPRAWERVSIMEDTFADPDSPLLRKAIYGLVGNGAGVEYCAFREVAREFDDVLALMSDPTLPVVIPEKADRRHAFCAAVAYYLWRGATPEDEARLLDGFFRIELALPGDFATMLMIDALYGHDANQCAAYAEKLYSHPRFPEWERAFGEAMRKRMTNDE